MGINLKFLIIGLGSMGKRRIRNLDALGFRDVAGFDTREDRCVEAKGKYEVATYSTIDSALDSHQPDVVIISTPPQFHMHYAFLALDRNLPCFIEASVVDADKILELHHKSEESGVFMAPSCTMKYNNGPIKVKELISAGSIGDPLNINYQTGQYLPDWHPWENIEDFYVSNPDTGGCREIVPFELTWLSDIFGDANALACVKSKLTDINAEIDDIYHCLLEFSANVLANITVEVISQPTAIRELRVTGTQGQLVFSADENCVRYINTQMDQWQRFTFDKGTVEANYINPEEPYIAEMRDFTNAVIRQDKNIFPNSLLDDYHILQTLYRLEELSESLQ